MLRYNQGPRVNINQNSANLVSVVGGSPEKGASIQQIQAVVNVMNNQGPNMTNSKKKKNRGGRNRNRGGQIQGSVRPIQNQSQKQSNPQSRIAILSDPPFQPQANMPRSGFTSPTNQGRTNPVLISPSNQGRPNPTLTSASSQGRPNPTLSSASNQGRPSPALTSPTNQPQQQRLLRQESRPENFTFKALPRFVHMNVGITIYLDTMSTKIYEPGKTDFDAVLLARPTMWHQFVVHHNGKFRKKEILKALFALVNFQELFPIGYREYDLHDVFLLTSTDKAGIEVLFKKNLRLRIHDTELCISVQLGAGEIQSGQVHPKAQFILVCQELCEIATLHGNEQCLNMEGFEKHQALMEISMSLSNRYHLMTIIKVLIEYVPAIQSIKGIKFANCGIDKIDAFRHLSKFSNLEYIDLRNNRLESVFDLKHMEKLNLTRLDIAGNPFAEKEELTHLQEKIKKMLPTLKLLDGYEPLIRPKVEPGLHTGEDLGFDIMLEGDQISINDMHDLHNIYASFRQRYKASNYWHKVTVFHEGQYNRKQVVSKLLTLVDNNDLWPCYYSSMQTYDEFYVHNNFDALEVLLRNKLIIKSTDNDAPLQLMLTMNISPFKVGQVDIIDKIQKFVVEAFNYKTLNLSSMADREIFKNVIIDMSSPRVLSQIILWASRKVSQQCTAILLNNNGIVSCAGMYPLCWFTKLEYLNLRNNQIESFDRLSGIPAGSKITSVFFEGNPLCNCSLQSYVKNIKSYFSDVKTIDGAPVDNEIIMLARQNYLCKPEAYTFVESFIKHYFKIYDSNQKQMLKDLYMDKALFTISTNFDPVRSKEVSRMSKYTSKARNILRLVNLDQSTKNVFVGPDVISNTLIELHETEHNFMSFCVDVPIYTKTFSVITIDGVFKDKPTQFLDDEFLVHFTRTFTVRSCDTGMGVSGLSHQFKIQNDMLVVRNVSTMEKMNSIENKPQPDDDPNEEMTENEMENLVVVFQEMTSLNKHWCNRFLKEANWNFKVALKLCVKLLEDNNIPEDAFVKS